MLERQKVVPPSMATGVAIGVVAAEVLVGLWLLSHVRARRACVAAVALLLAFCAYLLLAYRHVGNANCGCLGRIAHHRPG